MEHRWNEIDRGKPKYSGGGGGGVNFPSATFSTKKPKWTDPGSNQGLRGAIPATNRLSHGTALESTFCSPHAHSYAKCLQIEHLYRCDRTQCLCLQLYRYDRTQCLCLQLYRYDRTQCLCLQLYRYDRTQCLCLQLYRCDRTQCLCLQLYIHSHVRETCYKNKSLTKVSQRAVYQVKTYHQKLVCIYKVQFALKNNLIIVI
jgi:hypothetical protein